MELVISYIVYLLPSYPNLFAILWIHPSCLARYPLYLRFATYRRYLKNPVSEDQLRPISLLSIPSKLMEHCVLNGLKGMFLAWVPHHQFAYKPKSNTTCALISLHDTITMFMEDERCIGVIVISYDFSKAFDTLPHHILLKKIQDLQFPSGFVLWLHSYLSGRKQRVRVGHTWSDPLPVSSGVPQGSLLGPFLFMMMCHDISVYHKDCALMQYADDTTVACPIYSDSDTLSIVNPEVDHMEKWANSNGFKLNSSKTKTLFLTKKIAFSAFSFTGAASSSMQFFENPRSHLVFWLDMGPSFRVGWTELCSSPSLAENVVPQHFSRWSVDYFWLCHCKPNDVCHRTFWSAPLSY